MDLLVFGLIGLFPLLDHLRLQFLVKTSMYGVHGDRALELLELLLNLSALCLLFIQFVLQFACHAVVTILSLLQVVAHLMHVR